MIRAVVDGVKGTQLVQSLQADFAAQQTGRAAAAAGRTESSMDASRRRSRSAVKPR